MEKVNLLGVDISNITSLELNDNIASVIEAKRKCNVLNVNINAMNIAFENSWFRNMLNKAEINFCDGDGVRLGAKIQGKRIKEKITYNRWIWELAAYSEKKGYSWYMLGSTSENILKASQVLMDNYPNLKIIGSHHGYLTEEEVLTKVITEINLLKPNILCLGMGMPVQEQFLLKHFNNLNFNVSLTGGAVFDYISGDFKMTPAIFYKLKLEWFYRFLQQPSRLFKRYFVGNFLFIYRVIINAKPND